MNAQDFIDFASKIAVASSHGPAGYRSAVSRAYYGAFLLSRQYLLRLNFFARTGTNEHQFVQQHFQNCVNPEAKDIGALLQNLHESRKLADYKLDRADAETPKNAQFCVERASQIKDKLTICCAADTQQVILLEMTAFRKAANIT